MARLKLPASLIFIAITAVIISGLNAEAISPDEIRNHFNQLVTIFQQGLKSISTGIKERIQAITNFIVRMVRSFCQRYFHKNNHNNTEVERKDKNIQKRATKNKNK